MSINDSKVLRCCWEDGFFVFAVAFAALQVRDEKKIDGDVC